MCGLRTFIKIPESFPAQYLIYVMSYNTTTHPLLSEELASRKEFGAFRREEPSQDPERFFQLASQQAFVQTFLNPHTPWRGVFLEHACHSPGQMILMADGTQRACADLHVGDFIMGELGPVEIKCLHSGFEQMYKIISSDSREFTCNRSHVLSLISWDNDCYSAHRVDMTVGQYLERTSDTEYLLYSRGIDEFSARKPTLPRMSGQSAEFLGANLSRLSLARIPSECMLAPRSTRERFIDGLFKSGSDNDVFICTVETFGKQIISDICRICWSLGVSCKYVPDLEELHIIRKGKIRSYVPVSHKVVDMLEFMTFTIEPLGIGEYCGFSLGSQCPRYFLGNYIITHNTGAGKTIGAISPAYVFAQVYQTLYSREVATHVRGKKMYQEIDARLPNIFVFGFDSTKRAFLRDLLSRPEFGFVNSAEIEELAARKRLEDKGVPGAADSVREFYLMLKRRVFKKSQGGFLRFFGYDEFVNRLFITDLKLSDIEAEALAAGTPTEDKIAELIRENKITINKSVLASFQDSLIIADEIHNTYNSISKNSRGVALKYLLDAVPTVRIITLSATPANNSPAEFVDLMDYHLPPNLRVRRKDIFSTSTRELREGAEEILRSRMRGWVSYFIDDNPELYPSHEIIGSTLSVQHIQNVWAGGEIPYLKFELVPMSEYHQRALEDHTRQRNISSTVEESDHYIISTDSYGLYDLVFPSLPENYQESDDHDGAHELPLGEIGWYRSGDLKHNLMSAPDSWKQKIGITATTWNGIFVIGGTWLAMPGLSMFSSKHARLMEMLFEVFTSARGDPMETQKSLVYHNMIVTGGVILIQEIFRENGIIDMYSAPTDFTVCMCCGLRAGVHSDSGWYREQPGMDIASHLFIPARFSIVHSEIDRSEMTTVMENYNLPSNYLGHQCAIMIGAKIIRESYEFKDVRNLYLLSVPLDISMEIQIFGRVIRTNSHVNLPAEKRNVKIHLIINVINDKFPHSFREAPEVYKYADKMADFLVIQKIEKIMHEVAIDGLIHRNTIMSRAGLREFFPGCPECHNDPWKICPCKPTNTLRGLYYYPEASADWSKMPASDSMTRASWLAYGGNFREIELISYCLKRLFAERPAWTYDELLGALRSVKYRIPMDPRYFDEECFIVALRNLTDKAIPVVVQSSATKALIATPKLSLEEMLSDYKYRGVRTSYGESFVTRAGKYYVLVPAGQRLDVDIFARAPATSSEISINIPAYLLEHPHKDVSVWIAEWARRSREKYAELGFLSDVPAHFQEWVVRNTIEGISINVENLDVAVRALKSVGVFIYGEEILRYRAVAAQFTESSSINPEASIGYTKGKSIHLYDTIARKWFSVARTALNRQSTGKEAPDVVGILAEHGDLIKFKLRAPLGKSGRQIESIRGVLRNNVDFRTIERGIVCSTKTKESLEEIAKMLGIDIPNLKSMRTPKICMRIAETILSREVSEIANNGLVKYMYGWWDDIPEITSKVNKKLNKRHKL